ncbi:FAD-dependent oxidoreductase [Candidatus Gottesmanbacteria bacterium]|nr:FAD-dependent oxidoreductase [Candidatus Gottesmanbacteria bacterium]
MTYDLIIIGAGPAGLTASIYASCYHLLHIVIGRELGGQLQLAPDILNYPGFEKISGKELTERIINQLKKRGGELTIGSVVKIKSNNGLFEIEIQEGNKYQAKAIILATGTERRKLNVPGEGEYTSKGVHYCATCEKFDYEGKVCGVVGGANSAVQAAVELSQAASKVYIIYRGTQLRGDAVWLEQVEKHPNIEAIYNTVVTEIIGDGEKVTGVKIKSTSAGPAARVSQGDASSRSPQASSPNGSASLGSSSLASPTDNLLQLDKLFIEIGGVPGTALVIPLGVEVDPGGFIITDQKLATNVPGIFAAGDLVTFGYNLEQISSAVGLGARSAASAFAYLKGDKAPTVWGGSQIKR